MCGTKLLLQCANFRYCRDWDIDPHQHERSNSPFTSPLASTNVSALHSLRRIVEPFLGNTTVAPVHTLVREFTCNYRVRGGALHVGGPPYRNDLIFCRTGFVQCKQLASTALWEGCAYGRHLRGLLHGI